MERATRNLAGPVIRRIRMEQELSQADLAARCQTIGWDISRDMIAAIEDQSRSVTETEIVLLATVLKVDPVELLPSKRAALTAARPLTFGEEKPESKPKKRRKWFGL